MAIRDIRVANERDKIFGKSIAATLLELLSTRLSFSPARFESHRIARKDRGSVEDGEKENVQAARCRDPSAFPPFLLLSGFPLSLSLSLSFSLG